MNRPKIIAIDFDNTITANDKSFPDSSLSDVKSNAKYFINKLYDEGYFIIVWTCRSSIEHILDCKRFLGEEGIKYHSINENYPFLDFKPSKKIYYDYLVDDKAILKVNWKYEYAKIKTKYIESELFKITDEIKQYYFDRTKNHIDSVFNYWEKYCRISKSVPKGTIFEHDLCKFEHPELEAYVAVVWNYHCKDLRINFEISDELRKAMNGATEHHIRENKHHPEYWCPNKYDRDLIAKNERDKFDPNSMEIIDSTSMPEECLVEMCADWCATGQERHNTPFEWADKVINARWKFTDKQINFIYSALHVMWDK